MVQESYSQNFLSRLENNKGIDEQLEGKRQNSPYVSSSEIVKFINQGYVSVYIETSL